MNVRTARGAKWTGASREETHAALMVAGLMLLGIAAFFLLYWGPRAALLNLFFPGAAFVIAVWLYAEAPVYYVGYVWWIWFLAPFVRRIIDYKLGFFNVNPLPLLTPYMVTGLTLFTVLRFGSRLKDPLYRPFMLALGSVAYGFLVGIATAADKVEATINLLEWLTPVLFGFHIAVMWKQYPRHRKVVQTTFTWGVLVMGLYGIFQYFVAPGWDAQWMIGSHMTSIGKPEPHMVRVFGTLNAPGPYAMVMMAGLVLLFDAKGLVSRFAAVPGYVGFLLAIVRGSWGGWVLSLMYLIVRLRGYLRVRLIAIVAVVAVLSVPLLLIGPIAQTVGARMETFSDLEEDGSFQARSSLYSQAQSLILNNPVGQGLGRGRIDSGVIALPYQLGWFGSLLYFGSLFLALHIALRCTASNTDQFTVVVTSVVVSFTALMVASNQVTGVKGVVVWAFIGLVIASRTYYDESAAAP